MSDPEKQDPPQGGVEVPMGASSVTPASAQCGDDASRVKGPEVPTSDPTTESTHPPPMVPVGGTSGSASHPNSGEESGEMEPPGFGDTAGIGRYGVVGPGRAPFPLVLFAEVPPERPQRGLLPRGMRPPRRNGSRQWWRP